ncbi:HD domain-containing protein [Rhizobium sp. BR 315]|uniref:HD domain-containing protein n=1 Tax=Rhizobium sp. BR 315 TaxID=3040014 RepID=UPI003D33BE6E
MSYNPVEDLRTTPVYAALLASDSTYAGRIETFVGELAPVLGTTVDHFPYYTRHDAIHGCNVVRRIGNVLKPACLLPGTDFTLAPAELFLLIAAAYAHDLGMTVFSGEEDRILAGLQVEKTAHWKLDPTLQAHLRDQHSARGGAYIEEHATRLGIPFPLVKPLDMMMRAHNLGLTELESQLQLPIAVDARPVDLKQLAVILCVADAMEFSDTRVVEGVIERIAKDPSDAAKRSYLENMKHLAIGSGLAVRDDGGVLVSGTFSDEESLALAHLTFDEIQHWIQGYCDMDRRAKAPRLAVNAEPITRNLMFTGGRFERLGVRLNKKNVIELISSNAVWQQNRGAVVRELVQNAVEACRYRRYHSGPSDRYEPAVRVEFDRDRRVMRVTDNGCGMSERTVLNNFLTVGSSRSKEPDYARGGYASIARFGVGFWSVFTIATRTKISTAPIEQNLRDPVKAASAEGFEFEVSLSELKEYTVFRPRTRPCGTSVELFLDDAVIIDELYGQGREAIMCSEVPISFFLDEKEEVLPTTVPDVTPADIIGARGRLVAERGIEFFQWRHSEDGMDVSMALAYRTDGGRATFLVEKGQSLLGAFGGLRHSRTAVAGFPVNVRLPRLCFDIDRVGQFAANRMDPANFSFILDRQGLINDREAQAPGRKTVALIHDGYRQFLKNTSSYNPASIAALEHEAAMHGGHVVDSYTGTELQEAASEYPDLAAIRLDQAIPGQRFGTQPIFADLNDLKRMKGEVFFIQISKGERYYYDWHEFEAAGIAHHLVLGLHPEISGRPMYVMTSNRIGSMLFDCDEQSTVLFAHSEQLGLIVLQRIDLQRVDYSSPPQGMIVEVHGRWSGAIYRRRFDGPNGKPFVFLGRHRLLVKEGTKLEDHLVELAAGKRYLTIANIANELQEAENGFTPPQIAHLM